MPAAGVVAAVGQPNAPSCLRALGLASTSSSPSLQEVVRKCAANDQLLDQLLRQRDHALHACLSMLQV